MISKTQDTDSLVSVASAILTHTAQLSQHLFQQSITPPSLHVGASSELWTTHSGQIEELRSNILGLTQRLDKLLEGPHGFLHEYVSPSWEHGALYTLLEFDVLQKIPLEEGAAVTAVRLAEQSNLPAEKLLRICRLAATAGILEENNEGEFGHTVISETLVKDEGFRSWVHFQLFETRVASAHLADSLKKPNPFWTGKAAFEQAWGMPMYTWHAQNPEKGKRFAQAMESVAQTLDPGNGLVIDWLSSHAEVSQASKGRLIEVSGKTGSFSQHLATLFPALSFEVEDPSADLLSRGKQLLDPSLTDRVHFEKRDLFGPRSVEDLGGVGSATFLIRSVLWSLPDDAVIELLQSFVPSLQRHQTGGPAPCLLICDLVSPAYGTFAPHIEKAFRRRDVTLMTMHNVQQRTAKEWRNLIRKADGRFKATYSERYSSHSCRGLWQVQLQDDVENDGSDSDHSDKFDSEF
ncbi:putative O-methyltransferase [Lophiostoma macrostomum CBS 122681]|uniref:Putative O-methyltransferase n=1 Tax=Lophiostoma macrostomum CBS 122681 TaxID=1314788 RepID=A0A6A6T6W1_9PLEO|nr:putative O-methyltransferase [Lophiostoma macrostomum CBS 122681]